MPAICPGCSRRPSRPTHAYCTTCHSAYMRKWRKGRKLSPEQYAKNKCRAYANVYKKRGKLIQAPCADCGNPESQMHHEDYSKPLEVTWLCRKCHLGLHRRA